MPIDIAHAPFHLNAAVAKAKEVQENTKGPSSRRYKDDLGNFSEDKIGLQNCPPFCNCTVTPALLLIKGCIRDPVKYLDPLLRNNLNITSLTIITSSLTSLPLLVCNMTRLTSLDVSNNLIENLPWSCLKQLQYLSNIRASGNIIKKLENGSFYDFPTLQEVDLNHNKILDIDVDVFKQIERLPFLNRLHLGYNKIVSLDPWPLMFSDRAPVIELYGNHISRFTNRFNWNFTCDSEKPAAQIDLSDNKITHFSHIFRAWNINTEVNQLCLFTGNARVDLNTNPYTCDCTDYPIYRFLQLYKHTRLDEMFCWKPKKLYFQRLISMDLDEVVCNVKKQCPNECDCINQPNQMKMYINCGGSGISNLPVRLPLLPKHHYKYQLNFSHTNITYIDYRPYLSMSSAVFFSHCNIKNISIEALNALSMAEIVHLDSSHLEYLPKNISIVDMSSVKNIYLSKNNWICDCHAKETRLWMIKTNQSIIDKEGILCEGPSRMKGLNVLSLKTDDLICGNPPDKTLIAYLGAGASTLGMLILASAAALILKHKRIWLYKRFQWHPFDMDECEGEDKEFDVFLSYANENEEYVEYDLIRNLEKRGYKIAFHRVNFPGGQPIHVSIEQCIRKSKRTLVVLSNDFVNSSWCMWEFAAALELDGNEGTHRLLTIKYEDVDVGSLDLTLQTYFNRYTYILQNSPTFWDNLVYSLPQKKMGKPDTQVYDADNTDDPLLDDQLYIDDGDIAPLLQNH